MCGRVYSTLSPETVAGLFGKATNVKGGEKCYTSFNAAPTRFMPLAKTTRSRAANKKKEIKKVDVEIEAMKWGMFIPNSTDIVIKLMVDLKNWSRSPSSADYLKENELSLLYKAITSGSSRLSSPS